ncbi:MAG: chemotaxis protein CheW [Methanoregula sp.]|nr:chemotaxis protein CheW [Methanoregula sp.]
MPPETADASLPGNFRTPSEGAAANLTESIQVVEFLLGKEHYAINLFEVKEVVDYTTITRLPNIPPFIRGIIDLRGEITTIVDLKQRLNLAVTTEDPDNENGRIIVLDEKLTGMKTGVLVDDVLSVSTFDPGDVDCSQRSLYQENTAILGIIRKKVKVHDRDVSDLIVWIGLRQILMDTALTGTMNDGA